MTEAVRANAASPQTIAVPIRNLFVFQLWGIGDMIWTTPALGVLRKRYVGVPLTIVANSNAEAQVVRGSHLCDDVVTVGRSWKRLAALLRLAFQCRCRSGLAAVLMPGMSARLAQGLRYFGGFKLVVGGT